jgi:predicted negative regulator of RcsB-dependent stress response
MTEKKVKGASEDMSAALNKSEAFFNRNKKVLISSFVVLLVLVVGFFFYKTYVSMPRADKASTELAKAQELFNNEQFDKANEGFLKVINDFRGTDAANLANLYAGLCYANQNKWQEAVKYLENYSSQKDAMVSPAAMAALGNAYANTGNTDKAIKTLKKAAAMADSKSINDANYSLSATFLIQAGQLLESQKKNDDALKLYKEVKTKYVNAQQVQSKEIDKYIQRLEQK